MTFASWVRRRIERSARGNRNPEPRLLCDLEFAIVDVDLTGIDRDKDRVEGIAALAVVDGKFHLGDIRYCRLPAPPAGTEPSDWHGDYDRILATLAGRTVFTYNPRFVRWMLAKSAAALGLPEPPEPWMDIASAAGVVGQDGVEATSMDFWQKKMSSGGRQKHDAVYDVFAMAQLLQAILAYAEEIGIETLEDLIRNQEAEDWLRPY